MDLIGDCQYYSVTILKIIMQGIRKGRKRVGGKPGQVHAIAIGDFIPLCYHSSR